MSGGIIQLADEPYKDQYFNFDIEKNYDSIQWEKMHTMWGWSSATWEKEIDKLLVQLQSEWQVNALGPLYKKYKFSNFIKAMEFANKITEIAEQAA